MPGGVGGFGTDAVEAGGALDDHLRAHKEQLSDELADVLGWVLLIANDQGIDLPTAFANKVIKNAQKYPADQARGRADKYTAYGEKKSQDSTE